MYISLKHKQVAKRQKYLREKNYNMYVHTRHSHTHQAILTPPCRLSHPQLAMPTPLCRPCHAYQIMLMHPCRPRHSHATPTLIHGIWTPPLGRPPLIIPIGTLSHGTLNPPFRSHILPITPSGTLNHGTLNPPFRARLPPMTPIPTLGPGILSFPFRACPPTHRHPHPTSAEPRNCETPLSGAPPADETHPRAEPNPLNGHASRP